MSQDPASQLPKSLPAPMAVVIGGAGIGLLLAAAGFAVMRSQKPSNEDLVSRFHPTKSGGLSSSFKGKWALAAAIRIIENDGSRKILLNVLKGISKRSK